MFTTEEAAQITGGTLFGDNVTVSAVSTDTRTIKSGDLFIAIRGESFDGNEFIAAAAEKGASAAISDRAAGSVKADIPVIYVKDTRTAQLALARAYRDRFGTWVCGVTGSVGKTSTKDMIYAVLSSARKTLKTEGNLNNDIGLPKTLFGLDESYGAAVIEMGMSDLGEISVLSAAAHPDCAVITNIGWCHIENLKTRENILKAKLEICDGLKPSAPLIVCGDDEYLSAVSEKALGRRVVRFGLSEGCDVRAADIEADADGSSFTLLADEKRYAARVPIAGEHHVINALAAFCVGREMGLSAEDIVPAFLSYEASGMRQRTEQRGGITVILDCYNASPSSMKSSLSVLGAMKPKGRRVAVLGDMLELGEVSRQLHTMVAEYIMANADCCFLYGKEMAACAEELKKHGFPAVHSEDKQELSQRLLGEIRSGDAVLFKGSRGMRMEEIAEKIK